MLQGTLRHPQTPEESWLAEHSGGSWRGGTAGQAEEENLEGVREGQPTMALAPVLIN